MAVSKGAISSIDMSTDYAWANDTGTFTPCGKFIKEGMTMPKEEPATVEMGDDTVSQTGTKAAGNVPFIDKANTGVMALVTAANQNTPVWLRLRMKDGTRKVFGGVDGASVTAGDFAPGMFGEYSDIRNIGLSATGANAGDLWKDSTLALV